MARMARMRRNCDQMLEFKIEQAEAKVAKKRAAHENTETSYFTLIESA